jgi:hypothetical protein
VDGGAYARRGEGEVSAAAVLGLAMGIDSIHDASCDVGHPAVLSFSKSNVDCETCFGCTSVGSSSIRSHPICIKLGAAGYHSVHAVERTVWRP